MITETDYVTVNVDTGGLQKGKHYEHIIQVTSNGGSYEVSVKLETSPELPGSISGQITDVSTDAGIDGVTVTATGPSSGSDATDSDGYCEILNLMPGFYAVTASKPNYVSKTIFADVYTGQTTTINFQMTVDEAYVADAFAETLFNPYYYLGRQAQSLSLFSEDFMKSLSNPLEYLAWFLSIGKYSSAATAMKEFLTIGSVCRMADYSVLLFLYPITSSNPLIYNFQDEFTRCLVPSWRPVDKSLMIESLGPRMTSTASGASVFSTHIH
jgi:hypothetical protein